MSWLEKGDLLERSEKIIHDTLMELRDDAGRKKTIYEIDILRQLCRSITSIGANLHEADVAYSKKEFMSKLSLVLKEANESQYWMKLLNKEFGLLFHEAVIDQVVQVIKIIKTILGKMKTTQ